MSTTHPQEMVRSTKPTSQREKVSEIQRALWRGVKEDDEQQIETAVQRGADLDLIRGDWTPLSMAAEKGRVRAVRVLIRLGAALEGRGRVRQRTALHRASGGGHEGVVRELLAAGASVGAEDRDRATPLHWAAYWGHMTIVRLLVEAGADLNSRNSQGKTPLALALWAKEDTTASYLQFFGAII